MFVDEQVGVNSAAKAYAINRLLMEMTQNNDLYNRYAWFEQKPHACHRTPRLSQNELADANTLFEQWLAAINKNGSLYPSE
ncbi:hypothetical protein ACN9JF_18690 (plasmid) [Pseudoalteromonas lipolytica]|uniref:hypothetical protein n=1 Tax=Pseudoalteromonas lipolytica TaxID=570156 RepID=UPI003BA1B004